MKLWNFSSQIITTGLCSGGLVAHKGSSSKDILYVYVCGYVHMISRGPGTVDPPGTELTGGSELPSMLRPKVGSSTGEQ